MKIAFVALTALASVFVGVGYILVGLLTLVWFMLLKSTIESFREA